MNHSRDFSWLIRLAAITGLVLFGALLFGAEPGSAAPVTPAAPPRAIPTPTRIDTGGGSTQQDTPTWLFWLVPGFAVIALGAGVAGWWLARSDQSVR